VASDQFWIKLSRFPRLSIWLFFTVAFLVGNFIWTTIIQGDYLNQFLGESVFESAVIGLLLLVEWGWQVKKSRKQK
jgi:hypothetical protein